MSKTRTLLVIFIAIVFILQIVPTKYSIAEEEYREIVLNIPSLQLQLIKNGVTVKTYPVAVGKTISQTPIGKFKIISKVINPTWIPKGKPPVPSGPDNPLGYRWLGFHEGYGIHGNNNPKSIGTFVSLGCIRLHNKDIEELFKLVNIGDSVTIKYDTMIVKEIVCGEKYMEIYPDVYNLSANKKEKILKKLKDEDINIEHERLNRVLNSINKKKVLLFPGYRLIFNGEIISVSGLVFENDIYFKYEIMKNLFKDKIYYNIEDGSVLIGDGHMIPAREIDGMIHIPVKYLAEFLGADLKISSMDEEIELNANGMIFLNDSFITSDIYISNDEVYLPLRLLAKCLGFKVSWDSQRNKAVIGEYEVKGIISRGRTYVHPSEAEMIFDIKVFLDKERKEVFINTPNCFIEGEPAGFPVFLIGEEPFLPLRALASELGYEVGWHDGKAYINNEEVSIYLDNGKSYVSVEDTVSLFNINIEWDDIQRLNILTKKRQY